MERLTTDFINKVADIFQDQIILCVARFLWRKKRTACSKEEE